MRRCARRAGPAAAPSLARGTSAPAHRSGFSLVELAVALVVFEIGVLGVVSLMVLAAREIARAADVQRAVGAAEVVADSLLRFGVVDGDSTVIGPHTVLWRREGAILRVEARRTSSPGEPLVAFDLPADTVALAQLAPRPDP